MSVLGDVARATADKPLVKVTKFPDDALFEQLHDKALYWVFNDPCTRHLEYGLLGQKRGDDDKDRAHKREHRQRLAESAPKQIHDRR